MTEKELGVRLEKFSNELADKIAVMVGIRTEAPKPQTRRIIATDRNNLPPIPTGLRLIESPQPGAEYYIGATVAEGLGEGESSLVVIKVGRHGLRDKQVAVFSSSMDKQSQFAEVLDAVGRNYNDAITAVELNRFDAPHHLLVTKHGYPNLYRREDKPEQLGWMTTSASKPRLVQTLKRALDTNFLEIECSASMIIPMADFLKNTSEAFESPVVKALAIALYCAHETDWD